MNPTQADPGGRPSSDTPFEMAVERRAGAAVVRLTGPCTMNVAPRLGERMRELAADETLQMIVLDLHALEFIESSGLGGIISGYLRIRRRNGEIRIAAPRPAIKNLLELTRLTQLFKVFPDVNQAVATT